MSKLVNSILGAIRIIIIELFEPWGPPSALQNVVLGDFSLDFSLCDFFNLTLFHDLGRAFVSRWKVSALSLRFRTLSSQFIGWILDATRIIFQARTFVQFRCFARLPFQLNFFLGSFVRVNFWAARPKPFGIWAHWCLLALLGWRKGRLSGKIYFLFCKQSRLMEKELRLLTLGDRVADGRVFK